MKVLIVADGRSPITARWISGLLGLGYQVALISTYPCQPLEGLSEQFILPVAFAAMAGSQSGRGKTSPSKKMVQPFISHFRSLFLAGRYYFGPWHVKRCASAYVELVQKIKPDLVHALRIPYEGMLASYTPDDIPLAVSVWGNDLTLHASGSPWMKTATTRTLERADVLVADARRDIRLGKMWGFSEEKPNLVVPGNGGIDLQFIPQREKRSLPFIQGIPPDAPLVVNPRGFRPGSVRNDMFFYAIPLVLQRNPDVFFILPAMAGQAQAYRWVQNLHIGERVKLLPLLFMALLLVRGWFGGCFTIAE